MALTYAKIAQRAFNTPLLVEPTKAMAFISGLGDRLTGAQITINGPHMDETEVSAAALPAQGSLIGQSLSNRFQQRGQRPFSLIGDVAVIEVTGTLVHRGSWVGESSGVTSYEGLSAQLDAALADPAVRAIALEIDSFGGEVAGAFDFADRIRAARDKKPIRAFVAENALSAGYIIASQADHIVVPRTGSVGSIGVVVMHTEMSRRLEKEGITVNLIHSGAHKVEGNPYEALPENVRAEIQGQIDKARGMFADTVGAGRGDRLTAGAALATEAKVYRGSDAVAAGLADEVADPVEAFKVFAGESIARGDESGGGMSMAAPARGQNTARATTENRGGSTMDPQELASQVEALQAQVSSLQNAQTAMIGAAAEAGVTIELAEDGTVSATAATPDTVEYIEIEGERVEKSAVHPAVLKALDSQAAKLAKAEAREHNRTLAERGAAELPHLGGTDLAKGKMLELADKDADIMTALKAADGAMAKHFDERGENTPADESAPDFKLDKMARAYAAEHGVKFEAAYLAVSETAEGQALVKAAMAGSH
jgi:signal peptide peptidase SppA